MCAQRLRVVGYSGREGGCRIERRRTRAEVCVIRKRVCNSSDG